jgi:flagellar biosynthesis protein FlhB
MYDVDVSRIKRNNYKELFSSSIIQPIQYISSLMNCYYWLILMCLISLMNVALANMKY